MNPTAKARCPQCSAPARVDQGNPWRPFCSERCKLLDLGAWTSERYTIAADEEVPGEESPQGLPKSQ